MKRRRAQTTLPALIAFARRLETLRVERGLSQRALAARAKISTNHYLDIAHARANPSVLVLVNLAGALDVSIVDLLESRLPPRDERAVLRQDLDDLADALRRLTDIAHRLLEHDGPGARRPGALRRRR